MSDYKQQNPTNKIPPSNECDVEIARIQAQVSIELKGIDLEITRSNGRWESVKVIGSVITGILALMGAIVPALLAWKGDLKVSIPQSCLWYFLLASTFIFLIIAIVLFISWRLERSGKKRAIEEKQKFQKIAENSDAYRSSSCLTTQGDTPKKGDNHVGN